MIFINIRVHLRHKSLLLILPERVSMMASRSYPTKPLELQRNRPQSYSREYIGVILVLMNK